MTKSTTNELINTSGERDLNNHASIAPRHLRLQHRRKFDQLPDSYQTLCGRGRLPNSKISITNCHWTRFVVFPACEFEGKSDEFIKGFLGWEAFVRKENNSTAYAYEPEVRRTKTRVLVVHQGGII